MASERKMFFSVIDLIAEWRVCEEDAYLDLR